MKKGFTLIELLVVVLIIGILASVALPQYTKAVEKSRATEAIQLLGNLATAEQIYQMTTGSYTNDLTLLDIQLPGVSSTTTATTLSKNFRITVTGSGTTFTANAVRVNSAGSATTGENAYAIMVNLNASGNMTRWCNASAATSVPSSFSTSSKICKAIANNSTGQIK